MHRKDPRPQRSAPGVARSEGHGRSLCMTWISARGAGSVPTEAARRSDRLKFAEVQLADRSQCLRGRAVLKAVRQAFEPGRILNLRLHESGDVVGPSAGSAAMIGRPVDADDRYSSCPCRTVPGLAFGV